MGLRSRLLDNRLTFNATAFHTNVKDFQFTQFIGVGFITSNLPVRSRGFELDTRFDVNDAFSLFGSVVHADAIDTSTGLQLERSPKWDATFGGNVTHETSVGTFDLNVNGTYVSELLNDPAPPAGNPVVFGAAAEPITKINARLALTLPSDKLELAVLARNIFDEQTIAFASPLTCSLTCLPPEAFGPITERRTVMISATARF